MRRKIKPEKIRGKKTRKNLLNTFYVSRHLYLLFHLILITTLCGKYYKVEDFVALQGNLASIELIGAGIYIVRLSFKFYLSNVILNVNTLYLSISQPNISSLPLQVSRNSLKITHYYWQKLCVKYIAASFYVPKDFTHLCHLVLVLWEVCSSFPIFIPLTYTF